MSERLATPFTASPEQLEKAQSFVKTHVFPEVRDYDAYVKKQCQDIASQEPITDRTPFWLRRNFYGSGAAVDCLAVGGGESPSTAGMIDVETDGPIGVTLVLMEPSPNPGEGNIPTGIWTKPYSVETIAEAMAAVEQRVAE